MRPILFLKNRTFHPTILFEKAIFYINRSGTKQIDMSRIENPKQNGYIHHQTEEELQKVKQLIAEGKVVDCGTTMWGVPPTPPLQTNSTQEIDAGTTTYGFWVKNLSKKK